MRKILTLLFLITFSATILGQVTNESELIGKWKVEKIIEKPTNAQFKPLIDAFERATFHFNANKDFNITTPNKTELFTMMMTEVINGTKWQFVKEKQLVRIGNQENRYTAMGILMKKENGNLYFHLEEGGLTFLMKKSK